jgi:hypothetical protein
MTTSEPSAADTAAVHALVTQMLLEDSVQTPGTPALGANLSGIETKSGTDKRETTQFTLTNNAASATIRGRN